MSKKSWWFYCSKV